MGRLADQDDYFETNEEGKLEDLEEFIGKGFAHGGEEDEHQMYEISDHEKIALTLRTARYKRGNDAIPP